jgi:hypothetical protein
MTPTPTFNRTPLKPMKRTTNFRLNLPFFKLKLTGVAVGMAVALAILTLVASIALAIFMAWVFIHNFMLISAGTFTEWNVGFLLIAAFYFIHIASDHPNSNSD